MHNANKTKYKISKWGLRDKKYALFVGALTKQGGAHYLIEAFKKLEDTAKTPNNFKLVIVEDSRDNHDEDYVKYLSLISEGRSNILFFCTQKGVSSKQLFKHAYLFVQPNENKVDLAQLFEAMTCAVAPLVSNVKENRVVVEESGLLFETKSVLDLRDKLAFLLNRPDEARRLGEEAKKRVQFGYVWVG